MGQAAHNLRRKRMAAGEDPRRNSMPPVELNPKPPEKGSKSELAIWAAEHGYRMAEGLTRAQMLKGIKREMRL